MVTWADATVVDTLDRAVHLNGEGEAVVYGAERLTYRELAARADHLAAGLHELGIRESDRIAVWLVNRPEWLITYFAAAKLGAILVAVNTRYTTEECRHILHTAGASVLVVQDEFRRRRYLDSVRELCPGIAEMDPGTWSSSEVPSLREVIAVGPGALRGSRAFQSVLDDGRRITAAGAAPPAAGTGPDDTFLILFTSGTTAKPKGVMLSHRNIVPNNYYSGERQQLGPRDRMLIVLPLSSAFSCAHALIAIMSHQGTVILLDSFSATECAQTIEHERCTVMYAVNSMFMDLIDAPDRAANDISSLRTGVGVLTADVAEAVRSELGIPDYHQGWGMTECGGVATLTSVVDPVAIRTHTVGTPLPGTEVKIAGPAAGSRAEDGAPGEILVRGSSVTSGYYHDAEATARLVDAEGWLHTSDLGQVLPGGYLRFLGRIKDTYKPNGYSVSPLEVEEVIRSLPGIRDVTVFGVPDSRTMEAGYAIVVREPSADSQLDADAVRRHCATRLAGYKIPRYVEFRDDDLPRNDLGKVLKARLLRETVDGMSARPADGAR